MDWWVLFLKEVGFPIAVASFVLLRLDRSVRKVHARIDAASETTNRRLAQIAFLLGALVGPDAARQAAEFAGIREDGGTDGTPGGSAAGARGSEGAEPAREEGLPAKEIVP